MVAIPKQPPKKKEEEKKGWNPDYSTSAYPVKPKKGPISGSKAKDPDSANSKMLQARTAERLTPSAKRRRERFLRRYLIHFQGRRAALEIGISEKTASKKASEFMREPYTLLLMEKLIKETDEEDLCTRREVIVGLKQEAHFYGNGNQPAVRVAAWGKLGKYLGMEKDKGDSTGNVYLTFDSQDEDA